MAKQNNNSFYEYKYLLYFCSNITDDSYLFENLVMSGGCIILLKNENNKNYEPFLLKLLLKNIDYIEITYKDDEKNLMNRIQHEINKYDCKSIASSSFKKVEKKNLLDTLKYNYIYNLLTFLSDNSTLTNQIKFSTMKLTGGDGRFYQRLKIINYNQVDFYFKGIDLELKIFINDINNFFTLKIIQGKTYFINTDGKLLIKKFTPFIINNVKKQKFTIIVKDNSFNCIIFDKFLILKYDIVANKIERIDIKTNNPAEVIF